jgi:hypothetical protein
MLKMLTTRNVAGWDRVLRALPMLATLYFWNAGALSGLGLIAAAIISVMLLVTSITGSCSIYYMMGLSTCPAPGAPRS